MTAPVEKIVAELREEAAYLSGRSLDRGCVDSGISSNLAGSSADLIEAQAAEIADLKRALKTARHDALEEAARAIARASKAYMDKSGSTKSKVEKRDFESMGIALVYAENAIRALQTKDQSHGA